MKPCLTIGLALFLLTNAFCQRDGVWVLGYNYYPNYDMAIDFRSGNADTITIPKNLYTFNSFSEICDTTGNILFYTNGESISNRIGDTMHNGKLVKSTIGNNFAIYQGTLILPYQSAQNKYHLFYEAINPIGNCNGGVDGQPFGLYHITVDMAKNNGYGEVIDSLHSKVFQDTLVMGKLTACKHANGKDWWVISHQYLNNTWIKLLIKDDTTIEKTYQNLGFAPSCSWDIVGQAVFSSDGQYYAVGGSDQSNRVMLFSFNRCTGVLDLRKTIQFPLPSKASQGISFSPSNKYLYITTFGSNIWQYDIGQDTLRLVGHVSNGNSDNLYLQQLAPDGKIYTSTGSGEKHLHIINYPDLEGAACNFDSAGFFLRTFNSTIPTFPNYTLDAIPIYQADAGINNTICSGDTIMLGLSDVTNIRYHWLNASFISDTTIARPNVNPPQTTQYYLQITELGNSNSCTERIDTVTVTVQQQPCSVGLTESTIARKLWVSPSPATDMVTVDYGFTDWNKGAVRLEIINELGQVVHQQSLPMYSGFQKIEVGGFAAGVYQVMVKRGNGVVGVSKFTKE